MKHTLPEVDAYIDRSADFAKPILVRVRSLFHQACPEIEESIKWSAPFFVYKGIVGYMAAFKNHVSFGFWKAGLMQDPEGLMQGAGNSEMSGIKVSSLEELPDDAILSRYIEEAVDLNERGIKVPRQNKGAAKPTPEVPDDLRAALQANRQAGKTFENFSDSKRRDYIEWLTAAKREATRAKRLATTIEWLSEGKPRNWKYMKEYR